MIPDTSGPTWLVPLAHYDPDLSCWRTSQGMFPSDWPTSSETCPRWGMTRAGELFELPTPALPTAAPASSSSLLPTPLTTDWNTPGTQWGASQGREQLRDIRVLLPTPVVNDMGEGKTPETWDAWTDSMKARHGNGNGHGPSLSIEALRLLPTPRASDGEKGGPNQRGSSGDLMLPSAVVQLLPTPSAADALGGHLSRSGDRSHELLLPGVAKALAIGAPMAPPSPDGKPSSDDPLPFPPSRDATAPD